MSFLTLVTCMAVAGMSYQYLATLADDRKFPPPGRSFDVGGHKLHLHCVGEQGPVVVMDAALGDSSVAWRAVQVDVAKFARACTYDRAGYGWSESGPPPRSSESTVRELHALLEKANINGPYFLVGHSLGGLNMRLFASLYPSEVAGLVLVDSAHEVQEDLVRKRWPGADPFKMPLVGKLILRTALLGVPRLLRTYLSPQKGPDAEAHALEIALASRTETSNAIRAEWAALPESFALARAAVKPFGDLPLVVVSRGKRVRGPMPGVPDLENSEKLWEELQEDLVRGSSRGKRVIARESGHNIPGEQPQAIVEAVEEVIRLARFSAK